MCLLIDKIASERGISKEDANYVYTFVTNYLIAAIPQFEEVINDVFEITETQKLEGDINKAVFLIQKQQWQEKFKNYILPPLH